MTEGTDNRRGKIREALKAGRLLKVLPRAVSVPGEVRATMMIGTGTGAPCSACREPILPNEMRIQYTYDAGTIISVHKICDELWREELSRPFPRA